MVDTLCFNGLNARTGRYLTPPMPAAQVAKLARGETLDPKELQALQRRLRHSRNVQFGPVEGIDPKAIEQTGWGVIFPFARPGTPAATRMAAIKAALAPLLNLRRAQASAKDARFFRVFDDAQGAWRPTDTKRRWLKRQGAGATGPANPEKVPYYLLIVAAPSVIDFRPQSLLDVQYAVGRLDFETVVEYARYAESVVAAEKGDGLALPRTAGFFGARSDDDASTMLSSAHLASPLAGWAAKEWTGWNIEAGLGADAKKSTLTDWLGAGKTPSLLFTASHGMGFPAGDVQQRTHQGALLCSDWPGPIEWDKAIPQDFYLAADDLGADARLHGLIAFNFACFGGGTPQRDTFPQLAKDGAPTDIAESAFVASLPQRMLSHPGGGALAVIGHVDRAWGYSFLSEDGSRRGRQTRQLEVFQSTLQRLVDGHPVGSALEYFNERYAELAADLTDVLEEAEYGEAIDDWELATLWTAQNDARGYAILGDPAVRLMVDREGAGRPRMPLELSASFDAPEEPAVPPVDDDPPAPEAPAAHTDFGWFSKDKADETQADAEPGMLKRFASEVGEKLREALADVTSLEIRTFVADGQDLAAVSKLRGDALAEEASLKAFTRMAMDGDIDLLVPRTNGKVDKELWAAHQEMVKQAQAHRMELIKTALMLIKPSKK